MWFSNKCKFFDKCNMYSKQSYTCNNNKGNYYGIFEFRPGGCYRDLEANGKESKYWINKLKV